MKRRLARELALQSLYQMEMNEVGARAAIAITIEEAQHDNEAGLEVAGSTISEQYVQELVEGVMVRKADIDDTLAQYLKGWKMDRLSRVDRQVLRLAAYELIYREDVPPKVVVNEAIELSKHFGTEESGKFVNGVLGKMLKELDQIKEKTQGGV
ncbi:transcription antitermination factor NusB [Paenibacillus sp. y28]|uniref:transcription antitermination factor NusB n=1 Tax=Paenibacillus sp. y28 TaxID=3129110 RepID=UPI0030170A1A